MKIRTRMALGGAAALATLAGTTQAGSDIDLVQTTSPSSFGTFKTANLTAANIATNLIQEFQVTGTYELSTVSFFGSGTNIDLYIVDAIAPIGSDPDSILWESQGISAPGSRSWRNFSVDSSVVLGPGTYYMVMASDDSAGGRWSLVNTLDPVTLNMGHDGLGSYEKGTPTQRIAGLSYTFFPGDSQAFAMRLTGTEIPAPATAAILAAGGLGIARRRRR